MKKEGPLILTLMLSFSESLMWWTEEWLVELGAMSALVK